MLKFLRWFGFLFLLVGCAGDKNLLRVDDFKLKSSILESKAAPMVRGDQSYLLFGKLTAEERKSAIGHYLIVRRKNADVPGIVRFYYQQVDTGSKKLLKERELPQGEDKAEFRVIGDEYFTKGRILAWKVELIEGGEVIATEQSYLW